MAGDVSKSKRNFVYTAISLAFLFLLVQPVPLAAQTSEDSAFALAQNRYHQSVPRHQLLKNGREYKHFYLLTEGHQYVGPMTMQSGELHYEGIHYPELKMNYDVYNQLLVVLLFLETKQQYIIPNPHKIQSFTLGDRQFVNFRDSSFAILPAGIYEKLNADTRPLVLLRHQKSLIKDFDSFTQNQYRFERISQYYVIYQGRAWPVKRKKDLLSVFGEAPDITAFIKKEKLRFKRRKPGFGESLVRVMEFAVNSDEREEK
jgi:hypothetical protein